MNRAMLPKPPHWATSHPPGWSTAARFAKSASWSGTQWNVAVERMASTGSSIGSGCSEVRVDVAHSVALRGEPLARLLEHRRRGIERDDLAAWDAREQQLGHPSRSAPGIEHALVASQRQPHQDLGAPACLRVGDAVVGDGVPVGGRHRNVEHRRRGRAEGPARSTS